MDEYAFEIQSPDAKGNWIAVDTNQTVKAYDEREAEEKARVFANDHYEQCRIRNIRLIKKHINPDGEI
jgi:hypothetical protein